MNKVVASDLRGFAAYWEAKGLSAGTLYQYNRHLERYFEDPERSFTLIDIREYTNAYLKRSRSAGRYAIRALKAFATYLAEENQEPNVLTLLRMPKEPTPAAHRTKVARPEEVQKMLDACSGDPQAVRDHAIISVLFATGMRRAELCRMEWEHIDWQTGAVLIPITKGGYPRTARLTPDAMKSLKKHLRSHNSDHVWPTLKGGPLVADSLSKVIEKRARQAGVSITPHCFRRGMAVDYLKRGGKEVYLQKLAGWKNSTMVQRYVNTVAEEESLDEHAFLYG